MTLPEWMLERPRPEAWGESPLTAKAASALHGQTAARRIFRGALAEFSSVLAGLTWSEVASRGNGPLRRLDPRAKILSVAALMLAAAFAHGTTALSAILIIGVALACASRIHLRMLRVWLTVPFFSALVILPAVLNVVTPGGAVIVLWHQPSGWELTVTDAGLYVACRFLLRLLSCVTLAMLLTSTTPPHRLFRGLRALGAPSLFVMLLSMMGRYLGMLVRMAEELHLARLSRSVVFGAALREQAWIAAGIGGLFRRTCRMADKVHLAMISRCYTGETHLLSEPRPRAVDWLAAAAASVVAACVIAGDRLL